MSPIFIITVVLLAFIVYMISRKQPSPATSNEAVRQASEQEDGSENSEGARKGSEEVETNAESVTSA